MKYHVFKTVFGWAAVLTNEGKLSKLILPHDTREEIESIAGSFGNASEMQPAVIEDICAYFSGKRVDFQCEFDFTGKSEFDIKVWKAAMQIPYGSTITYGQLACSIGHPNASRAAGSALGRNPLPVIIPCHRILRSDGGLGGFSAGLNWKIRLLDLEKSGI